MAAKSKYKAEFAKQAAKLCQQFGAIDKDLAAFFGVSLRTINTWKVKHPPFRRALDLGKDVADDRVERALYERAVGFSCIDTHFSSHEGKVTATEYERHYPPDTKAAMYWLSNRRRKDWSFRPDDTPGEGEDTPKAVQVEVIDGRKAD